MADIELFGSINAGALVLAFKGAPYLNELNIVCHSGVVTTLTAEIEQREFIRVTCTRTFKYLEDVLTRLSDVNVDVELQYLDGFLPASAKVWAIDKFTFVRGARQQ